jgi:hypothetical protein
MYVHGLLTNPRTISSNPKTIWRGVFESEKLTELE